MGKNVWIGTRGAEQWIKAPAPRAAFQPVGWSSTTQGRNGRTTGKRSRVTHMEYELNWPTVPTDVARKIVDMYYGLAGDGLIHWLDPMMKNALPAHWSFPGLSCTDGPVLSGNIRPVAVPTAANEKGLPSVSARFAGASPASPHCYIPIPPGHAAHIGVHSAGAAAATSVVTAQRYNGEQTVGAAVPLPAIAASDATRFTNVIARTDDITGIGIAIHPFQAVEARRNYNVNPRMLSSVVGWGVAVATQTATAAGTQIDFPTGRSANQVFFNQSGVPVAGTVAGGQVWSGSIEITVPAGFPAVTLAWSTRAYTGGTSHSAGSTTVTIQPGETVTVASTSATFAAGSNGVRNWLSSGATAIPTGARLIVKNALLEKAPAAGPYFDGSFGAGYTWTGTANNSPSIQTVTLPYSGDLAGLMVEVLPIGLSPEGQGFLRGEGNSGCRMFDPPTEIALHAAEGRLPRKSVAATLTEVGP